MFLIQAQELGREPNLKDWWKKTHMRDGKWVTPQAQEVYVSYPIFNFLI